MIEVHYWKDTRKTEKHFTQDFIHCSSVSIANFEHDLKNACAQTLKIMCEKNHHENMQTNRSYLKSLERKYCKWNTCAVQASGIMELWALSIRHPRTLIKRNQKTFKNRKPFKIGLTMVNLKYENWNTWSVQPVLLSCHECWLQIAISL